MALPKISRAGSKPKPFQRPAVDLDKPIRKWQEVRVSQLALEDIVPDLGLLTDIKMVSTSRGEGLRFTGAGGKEKTFTTDEIVFAFTTAK